MALAIAVLPSCNPIDNPTQEEEQEYYTAKQKEVLSIFHGSFSYTLYGTTTKISFSQPFSKPIEGKFSNGDKTEMHGKLTFHYWNGSSYDRYYRLHSDAKKIALYMVDESTKEIYKTELKDFQYVDSNTFKWKDTNDMVWDTYQRD